MAITKHVLYFSLVSAAATAYAYYSINYDTKSDQEKRTLLESKFNKEEQLQRKLRKAQMDSFFERVKANDQEQSDKMEEILKKGRS
eukprot:gene2546-2788_t